MFLQFAVQGAVAKIYRDLYGFTFIYQGNFRHPICQNSFFGPSPSYLWIAFSCSWPTIAPVGVV